MTTKTILALAVLAMATPVRAEPVTDISDRVSAEVIALGTSAQLTVTAEGWSCSGTLDMPEKKKNSGGRNTAQQKMTRLTCTDGSHAAARATRDDSRREWRITFIHKQHGRADLRVRET